jgi:hypothetical protein
MFAYVVVALTGYVLPPKLTDTTRNPILILSFAFSLRLSSVISTDAVAPAGITAPFDPSTAFETVAVNR